MDKTLAYPRHMAGRVSSANRSRVMVPARTGVSAWIARLFDPLRPACPMALDDRLRRDAGLGEATDSVGALHEAAGLDALAGHGLSVDQTLRFFRPGGEPR